MRLLQLYYTSCKQGRSAGSGFQIYSASEGLTKDEMMELEERSTYVPPSHLASQPTEDEIRQDFPVAFSSFRLKSGRYGVIQSVYVGQDYSGRFGNFFTHALVLEEGTWPFAASLLYGSPIFKTHLTEDELDIEQKPEDLPVLELSKPNGSLSLALVQNFLQENDRYTYLKAMINGVIERNGQPGSIVLADEPEYVPYWIVAIQLAFPTQIANEISFSTYSFDPASENNVVSVTLNEGTRFSFQDIGRRYNLYGFNFTTNQFSEPNKTFRYADYTIKHHLEIEALQTFSNRFTFTQPTEALDAFIDLYSILHADIFSDASRIQSAFQFATHYLATEQASEFIDELSIEQLMLYSEDIDNATAIARFLIDMSNKTNAFTHQQLAAQFLLDKSTDLATDNYALALDKVNEFLSNMTLMNSPKIIRDVFLSDEHLESLSVQLLDVGNPNITAFFLEHTLQFIDQAENSWEEITNRQQAFLTLFTGKILSQNNDEVNIAALFKTHPTFFSYISLALYQEQSADQKQLMHQFITVTKENQNIPNWVPTYYNLLNETTTGKGLLQEAFHIRFNSSTEITDMTDVLIDAVHIQGFDITPFILTYLEKLFQSEQHFIDNIQLLLQEQDIYDVLDQQNVLKDILDKGQNHLVFSDTSVETHLQAYEQFIAYYKEKNMDTSMYELVVVTFQTKGHRRKHAKELEKLLVTMLTDKQQQMTKENLQDYINWALPEVMHILYDNKKQNDELIEAFMYTHTDIILHALTNRRQKLKVKAQDSLLVDLFVGLHEQGAKKALYDQMVHYLLEYDYQHKKVQAFLEDEPKLLKKWEKMHEDVQQQKGNPLFRSIKKLFKS